LKHAIFTNLITISFKDDFPPKKLKHVSSQYKNQLHSACDIQWQVSLCIVTPRVIRRKYSNINTYFSRKRVTLDFMFRPEIVIGTEVYVELLELIAISQRTFSDVQNVFRLFIHSEHQRLSSVFDCSTDLLRQTDLL